MQNIIKIINQRKTLVITLEFFILAVLLFILLYPLYPAVEYKIKKKFNLRFSSGKLADSDNQREPMVFDIKEKSKPYNLSSNRLIIKKIGVNAPIVEDENANNGMNRGAWRMPKTSTPDKGSNTVIAGHRFKYLPPHNLTFYLFHELAPGDEVNVIWQGEEYNYKITETKIVPDTAVGILNPTEKPTLTMFTCDPIWTTKNRLVAVSELVD